MLLEFPRISVRAMEPAQQFAQPAIRLPTRNALHEPPKFRRPSQSLLANAQFFPVDHNHLVNKALAAVGHALALAGSMTWEITWALVLGFVLSAVVQAVVRRSTVVSLLGDDRPRTLAVAAGATPWRSCRPAASRPMKSSPSGF